MTQAWLRHAAGDTASATAVMDEAVRITDPAVADLLNPVPAQRACLWLAHGNVAAAERWTTERGLRPDDPARYPHEPAYLALARVLLARNEPGQARILLDRMHAAAVTQDRVGSIIEIQALRALALDASGDEPGSIAALADALTLAHPQGYARVFIDEGPPMRGLVGKLITSQRTDAGIDGIPLSYLGRLSRGFEHDAAQRAPGTPDRSQSRGHDTATQLSDREREVLRLLAAGKQNQQIAGELYLALNTVKKHVTHIFQKLGATNRTEATTRARQLGLLDSADQ